MYSRWCEEMNYHPDNYKNFRAAMEKVYTVRRKRPKSGGSENTMLIGARLRTEELGAEEEDNDAFRPLADEGCAV